MITLAALIACTAALALATYGWRSACSWLAEAEQ